MKELKKQEIDSTIFVNLDDLPLGQKILKLGLELITERQIADRMDCIDRERKINKDRLDKHQKEVNYFATNKRKDYNVKVMTTFRNNTIVMWEPKSCWSVQGEGQKIFDRPNEVRCEIVNVPLEQYMGDIMPDSTLEAYRYAKSIGLDEFHVYYPITREVERPNVKDDDPILVAKLGESLIFIAQWE